MCPEGPECLSGCPAPLCYPLVTPLVKCVGRLKKPNRRRGCLSGDEILRTELEARCRALKAEARREGQAQEQEVTSWRRTTRN